MITLTKGQEQALKIAVARYKNNEKYTCISGYAGTGKAQPNDTRIPTPDGFKKLGELKVGDYVFDRLGQPTKVLGVYPQGKLDVYKIYLSDGRTSLCNDNHLWTCYNKDKTFITYSLKEIMNIGLINDNNEFNFAIPNYFTDSDYIDIVKIENLNYREEMTCIYVNNPEHLYLTNDYIVTHNTTVTKIIVDSLNIPSKNVAYCSYTGKASEVMRKYGNEGAITAHKLLYKAYYSDGKWFYQQKEKLEDIGLVVVDEVSMLPKTMWDSLLSYPDVYVLALGDNYQLPPILDDPKEEQNILDRPHVQLTEIMRQAQESDIIKQTMSLRQNKPLKPYCGNDINIFRKADFKPEMLFWANQILCGTHKKRKEINQFMRQGKPNTPVIGDKIICAHNAWDIHSINGNPVINGTMGIVKDFSVEKVRYNSKNFNVTIPIMFTTLETNDGDIYNIPIDYNCFAKGRKSLSLKQEMIIKRAGKKYENLPLPLEFDYGYALTTHRAQGSQWGKVLVFEEMFSDDLETRQRLLYTAITRATSKVTVIMKN